MKSKQSSELFATMTEVLCVAYTYTSTIDTQSARTTPSHLKIYAGLHLWCCVQNAHLNPGAGLAFIRLCKHARFSITARVDDIQGYALIYLRECGIINSPIIQDL